MNDRQHETLDRLLGNLPKDVTPAPHLWPGIRARLAGTERRTPSFALAASVAVAAAFLASMLTWAVLQVRSLPRGMQAVAVPSAFEEPRDPKYLRAREMVQQTYRERLELLEPATRAKIESSLAVIRQAHEDIRKALAADPHSPVLEQLWESTWHDEYDLYDRVVQATQPHLMRI
jgi:hypothetical protein